MISDLYVLERLYGREEAGKLFAAGVRLKPAVEATREALRRWHEDGIEPHASEVLSEFVRLLRWHNKAAFRLVIHGLPRAEGIRR